MRKTTILPYICSRLLLSMLVLPVAVFAAGKTKTHTSSLPKIVSVEFERIDRMPAAWQKGSGIVFDNGRGEVVYRADYPKQISEVQAAVLTTPGQVPDWKIVKKDQRGEWLITLDAPGWYDVRVKARMQSGKELKRDITVAVLGNPISEELRRKSVFGLCRVHGDKQLIKLAGAKWDRRLISLRNVTEKQVAATVSEYPSPYTWRDDLKYVGAFAFGLPMWSMKIPKNYKQHGFGNPFFPAKDWNKVADIVRTYASLQAIPEIVEMYNEPLAHWTGSKQELVAYAAAVRKGLKAADKNFKLAGPSLYSIRTGDLEALAKAGLFEHLDAISMHAYVNGTPPEGIYLDRIIEMNQLLARYKQQKKPVYLTEFGWTSSDGSWQPPVDINTQTSYVARSLALGWSQNIDGMNFFALKFNTKNTGESGFSLFDPENRPRPGYVAFSAVSRFFAGSNSFGYYQLTPDVHMVAGQRDDKLQLAVWSTGKTTDIKLPFNITAAYDIFGKKISFDQKKIQCTENPVYLEAETDGMTGIKQLVPLKVTNTNPMPANVFWPMEIISSNPAKLESGRYTGFISKGENWNIQPIDLVTPITISDTNVTWPLDKAVPEIKVTVRSNLADTTQHPVVWINKERKLKLNVPENCIRQAIFPIRSFVPAKRFTTKINLQTGNSKIINTELEWGTLAAVSSGKENQWADFTEWNKFGNHDTGGKCEGKTKLSYDAKGILLEVQVTDDEHHQHKADNSPDRLWAADSIQVAFDMDTLKPWTAGVVGTGLSGHRIFEYSIGASSTGKAKVFRERSYIDGLPAKVLDSQAEADLKRDGDLTTYKIFFPWSSLGVDKPLPPGSVIGFSLAVNDVDPKRKARRHGIRLFEGITESKDAKKFGKVWLR